MNKDEHKQAINAGIMQMAVNALTEDLARVAAELDTAKARIAELEKPAEPKKE